MWRVRSVRTHDLHMLRPGELSRYLGRHVWRRMALLNNISGLMLLVLLRRADWLRATLRV
jgi:hypothetical protein